MVSQCAKALTATAPSSGKGEVAILDGIPVVPILQRVEGCKAALAEFPDIQLVDTQNGRQDRSVALGVVENMIQSKPNLAGIFSVNDGGAMGALAAIQGSGKDIKLVSVDGAPEAVKAIAEYHGGMATYDPGQGFSFTIHRAPRPGPESG